jgi:hypothetical protein
MSMSIYGRIDIPNAKAVIFRGRYTIVETTDGAAGLYCDSEKIASFMNLEAAYKGWGRAVRRWVKVKTPAIADVIRSKGPEWLAEWLAGADLKIEDRPDPEGVEKAIRLRRKLYEEVIKG